jgi:hypothetical protein
MTAYIKQNSDGVVMFSCDTQTITNPDHLEKLQSFVTSRGMNLADFTLGDATDQEVAQMIEDALTPMEIWVADMRGTDKGMPRFLEDHITDDHDGVAGNEFLQGKYDNKKALRATKP